jgi:uncharacterized phage protein (TIGR02220 family)
MKSGNWIPVDKRIVNLLPRDREYTFVEAYLSYRMDIESGAENSINGYARIWAWSRNKVRYFVEGLRTGKGHVVDNQRTGKGQEIRFIFKELEEATDSQGTGEGQAKDRQGTITIIKNKKKDIDTLPYAEIIADLNSKGGFKYKTGSATRKLIHARFADGFKKEDFFRVHTVKIAEWANTNMSKFLRPETLYSNKFDSYLNQKITICTTPAWH